MPSILPRLSPGDFLAHGGQEHYKVVIHRLGNGHAEGSITTYKTLSEPPSWLGMPDDRKEPVDPEANRRRAARAAKTMVRKKVKVMGCDSLYTLTYRVNVTDRELVARHWESFVRRVRSVIPDFAYVACLEQQKRGAWHIHVATHRLPATFKQGATRVKSWDLMRAIWRRVVGELGGNFDEQKRKFHSKSRAHKIARYISKYVAKSFDDNDESLAGKKRFWASHGCVIPASQVLLFAKESFADLIELLHFELGAGDCTTSTFFSRERGVFWMCSEAGSGP